MTTNGVVPEEILKQLKGLRELDVTRFPHMCLYGYNSTGKTYCACSASTVPELSPVCHIMITKTDTTLVGKKDIDLKQIVVVDPREYARKTSSQMWSAISNSIKSVRDLKPFPFKCVVLDDLTMMQYWAEQGAVAATQKEFHGGDSALLEMTQQGDYRLAKDRMIPLILDLIEVCDKNKAAFIMLAQERMLEIISEGEPMVDERGRAVKSYKSSLGLMPSIIQPLMGMVVVVGRMKTVGRKRVLETRRTQYLDAKDQTGFLDDRIEDPTMAKLLTQLEKGGWHIRQTEDEKATNKALTD